MTETPATRIGNLDSKKPSSFQGQVYMPVNSLTAYAYRSSPDSPPPWVNLEILAKFSPIPLTARLASDLDASMIAGCILAQALLVWPESRLSLLTVGQRMAAQLAAAPASTPAEEASRAAVLGDWRAIMDRLNDQVRIIPPVP